MAWVRTHTGRKLTEEMPSHPETPTSSSDLCSFHKMLCQRLDAHDAIVIVKFGQTKGQSVSWIVPVGTVLCLFCH